MPREKQPDIKIWQPLKNREEMEVQQPAAGDPGRTDQGFDESEEGSEIEEGFMNLSMLLHPA